MGNAAITEKLSAQEERTDCGACQTQTETTSSSDLPMTTVLHSPRWLYLATDNGNVQACRDLYARSADADISPAASIRERPGRFHCRWIQAPVAPLPLRDHAASATGSGHLE